MPWIGGALIGGGSLLSGLFGANAAGTAASDQAKAEQAALGVQLGEFGQIQGNESPFYQTGANAFKNLATLLGTGNSPGWNQGQLFQTPQQVAGIPNAPPGLNLTLPNDPSLAQMFRASPGYQYNLQQQQGAIQNSAAGKTGALSGNMLMALQANASGLADQDYQQFYQNLTGGELNQYNANNQNYWNQYNAGNQYQGNLYSRLLGLAELGQGAASNTGSAGVQLAGNAGQALVGMGNAAAGGTIGAANALSSGIGGAAGAVGNAFAQNQFNPYGYYQSYQQSPGYSDYVNNYPYTG